MLTYKAPIMDIKFLFEDVFDYYPHYLKTPEFSEATPDLVDAIFQECAKFCENLVGFPPHFSIPHFWWEIIPSRLL